MFKPRLQLIKRLTNEEENINSFHPPHIQICYASQKRIPIPLKNLDINLNIEVGFVRVEMIQNYQTDNFNEPLDIEYLFVIKEDAAVTKMVVLIGDETKYGIIKEKKEAQMEFEDGIQKGKTMAYSDQDEKLPYLKKLKIGSLAPNKNLTITFEYVQPLEVFLNKYWKIEISPLIDPFYLQEINESGYKQYLKQYIRNIAGREYEQFNYKQNINIEINLGTEVKIFKSPTHKIKQTDSKDVKKNQLLLQLDNTPENFQPNKQFILLFASDDTNLPRAILTHTSKDELQSQKYCATLAFMPKYNEVSLDDAYEQYLNELNIVPDQIINKGNYLFFLDRSGSMAGSRIEKAKEALILFLKSLPENSQFNIISFGSNYKSLWDKSKDYTQESLEEALKHVKDVKANMGGTEIFKPLNQILLQNKTDKQKNQQQLTQNIFLLTDGEVSARPIIDLIAQNNSAETRIYSVGIGKGCSQYLIRRIAEVGNGKYHIIDDNEDINAKIIDLLEDSLTYYLKAFNLETNAQNVQQIIPAPDSIVCLKKNKELMIQIIFSAEQTNNNIELNLSCYDPQEQKPIKFNIILNLEQSKQNEYFHKIAAHRFINIIEEATKNQELYVQKINYKENQLVEQDIINMSVQHQILSSRTAFVCEVCNLEDQFFQQIQQKQIIQQNMQFVEDIQFQQGFSIRGGVAGGNRGRGGYVKGKVAMREISKCRKVASDSSSESDSRSKSRSRDRDRKICISQNLLEQLSAGCYSERERFIQHKKTKKQTVIQQDSCKFSKTKNQVAQQQEEIKQQNKLLSYSILIQAAQAEGSFNLSDNLCLQLKIEQFQNPKGFQKNVWAILLGIQKFMVISICQRNKIFNKKWYKLQLRKTSINKQIQKLHFVLISLYLLYVNHLIMFFLIYYQCFKSFQKIKDYIFVKQMGHQVDKMFYYQKIQFIRLKLLGIYLKINFQKLYNIQIKKNTF